MSLQCVLWLTLAVSAVAWLPPPKFTVDMKLAPEQRYSGAVTLIVKKHGWDYSFGPVFANYNPRLFDKINATYTSNIAAVVKRRFPEQSEELRGIAQEFAQLGHPEVNWDYLCVWSLVHELQHINDFGETSSSNKECTSIVGVNQFNGQPFLVRNLDNQPASLRNVTLRITYINNVDPNTGASFTIESTCFYWFGGGVMTAVRQGVGAMSENFRSPDNTVSLEEMYNTFAAGASIPQNFQFRILLANSTSYDNLLVNILNMECLTGEYLAVSGINSKGRGDGSIIVRMNAGYNYYMISIGQQGTKYLAVTNNDWWNSYSTRLYTAQWVLNTTEIDPLSVFAAISNYPVMNPSTIYTAVMYPEEGSIFSIVRRPSWSPHSTPFDG